jgi:hypothetical protein
VANVISTYPPPPPPLPPEFAVPEAVVMPPPPPPPPPIRITREVCGDPDGFVHVPDEVKT